MVLALLSALDGLALGDLQVSSRSRRRAPRCVSAFPPPPCVRDVVKAVDGAGFYPAVFSGRMFTTQEICVPSGRPINTSTSRTADILPTTPPPWESARGHEVAIRLESLTEPQNFSSLSRHGRWPTIRRRGIEILDDPSAAQE